MLPKWKDFDKNRRTRIMAEEKTCSYCHKPITEKPEGYFKIPVCNSEDCIKKYHSDMRQVFQMFAGIGGRTLY